jgi:hypothetical protein
MNSYFLKIAALTSRRQLSHPVHTGWHWNRSLPVIFLLSGLFLLAQAGQSAAQGVQSQAGVLDQAREETGARGIAITVVPPPATMQMAAQNRATRTPRPTATPPVIPPPADPTSTNLMILLAAIIVVVILIGIWINPRAY